MRIVIGLLLILVIAVISTSFLLPRPLPTATPAPTVVVHSQGPTVERLQRLSHLVTTRVYIVDVLIGEGEGCRGAWLIKGDALVAVDLGRAQITEKNESTKEALIVLPWPEVLQPRVDHQRTKTWEVRRKVWLPWNANQDRLRDAMMFQAQQLVTQAADSDENLQQAQTTAATIVSAFHEEVGWQVSVTWKETSASGHIPNNIHHGRRLQLSPRSTDM